MAVHEESRAQKVHAVPAKVYIGLGDHSVLVYRHAMASNAGAKQWVCQDQLGEGDHGTESGLVHLWVCTPGHVLEGRRSPLGVVAQRDSNAAGRRNAFYHPDARRKVKTCRYGVGEGLLVGHGEVHSVV